MTNWKTKLLASSLAIILAFSGALSGTVAAQAPYQRGVINENLAVELDELVVDGEFNFAQANYLLGDFLGRVSTEAALELSLDGDFVVTAEMLLELGFERRDPSRFGVQGDFTTRQNMGALLHTVMDDAIGVIGFEGAYAFDSPYEIVEIVVQFRTPPSVAFELIAEVINPFARGGRGFFDEQAWVGHRNFEEQMVVQRLDNHVIEVIGAHHTLFNGLFLRVPAWMVYEIAALPEVFAVTPNVTFYAIGVFTDPYLFNDEANDSDLYFELEAEFENKDLDNGFIEYEIEDPVYEYGNEAEEPADNYEYEDEEPTNNDEEGDPNHYDAVDDRTYPVYEEIYVTTNFFMPLSPVAALGAAATSGYVRDGDFNRLARELFGIDFIHNQLEITGRGVRVGVLDTGIDHRHPAFAQYRINPADVNSPLPGGNFIADREMGWGTSGGEGASSMHGSHVAGTVIAMAPDIYLYSLRVLNNAGSSAGNSIMLAIEAAYDNNLDVINLSLGSPNNNAWNVLSQALNLVSLSGMVVVTAAGNDGDGVSGQNAHLNVGGWFSVGQPGVASLVIDVGGAFSGGHDRHVLDGVDLGGGITRTRALGFHRNSIFDANEADIVFVGYNALLSPDNFGFLQDIWADYVFFGQLPYGPENFPGDIIPDNFVTYFRNEYLSGADLTGRVMILTRGVMNFVHMSLLADALNASAIIMVNNQFTGAAGLVNGITYLSWVDGLRADRHVPFFQMSIYSARAAFDLPGMMPAFISAMPITGTMQFGTFEPLELAQDIMIPFSSVGPVAESFHITPDILAPGHGIMSANNINNAPGHIHGIYDIIQGTSMSAPAVAGIAALVIEQFNLTTRNYDRVVEVKSRLMNTAVPLTGYGGHYSVLQTGAGMVNPIAALMSNAFVTVVQHVPWLGGTFDPDGSGNLIGTTSGQWAEHTISSLNFGLNLFAPGVSVTTDTITATVNNAGGLWSATAQVIMPTVDLSRPPTRPPAQGWGVPLDHTDDFNVNIENNFDGTFGISLTFNGVVANAGYAQGFIIFTNGPETLRVPFGAMFAEAQPITRNTGFEVLFNPIMSNFVTTRDNFMQPDPRAIPAGQVAVDYFTQNPNSDSIFITPSNTSSLAIDFNCPLGITREVRFYVRPYGTAASQNRLVETIQRAPSSTSVFFDLIRAVVHEDGDSYDWSATHQGGGVHRIDGSVAHILAAGAYHLTAVVVHGHGMADLEIPFIFVVADERPTIVFDENPFEWSAGDTSATVSGQVVSAAQDLAMLHNLRTVWVWNDNPVQRTMFPIDYELTWIYLEDTGPNIGFFPNPNGTFSVNIPIPPASTHTPTAVNLMVMDGEGHRLVPPNFPTQLTANMVSLPQPAMIAYEDMGTPGVLPLVNFYHHSSVWANLRVPIRLAGAAGITYLSFDEQTVPALSWSLDTSQNELVVDYNFLLGITPAIAGGDILPFTVNFINGASSDFGVSVITPPGPLVGSGIWRPIISGNVTPPGGGVADIREHLSPGAGAGFSIITHSNVSPITFGFSDVTNTPRLVRFYVEPIGGGARQFLAQTAPNFAPNVHSWFGSMLQPILGGSVGAITGFPHVLAVTGGNLLPQGVYNLVGVVDDPIFGEVNVFTHGFVVESERPAIIYDRTVFAYAEGDAFVTITGRVNSFGHDMAIAHGLRGITSWTGTVVMSDANSAVFNYSNVWLRGPLATTNIELPVNADGTFSIDMAIDPASLTTPVSVNLFVSSADGFGAFSNAVGAAWNSITTGRASNRSLAHPFVYAEASIVIHEVTFNGNGGTPEMQVLPIGIFNSFGNNLPSAIQPGAVFLGWNTQADGNGQWLTGSTIVTNDIEVFAIWHILPQEHDEYYWNQAPHPVPPIEPQADDDEDEPVAEPEDEAEAEDEQDQDIIEILSFIDVDEDAWYADAVAFVVANGLFHGTSEYEFSPQIGMTRGMFVQVLANMAGVDLNAPELDASIFSDVNLDAWYARAVNWAAINNICPGRGDGTFEPSELITRQEMAVLLFNFAAIERIALTPITPVTTFSDADDIAYWAMVAVRAMQAAGVIQGHVDGTFAPNNTATRAEVAALFARFLLLVQN
ncbi:MAG: S8 family serine peptidase [Defluviitaleaceae bacterium]|nr:S8 family serine peptidase [Defluviitaleaceae bacterium]